MAAASGEPGGGVAAARRRRTAFRARMAEVAKAAIALRAEAEALYPGGGRAALERVIGHAQALAQDDDPAYKSVHT